MKFTHNFLQKYLNEHPECFSELEKYPGWTIFDVVKNKIQPALSRYCLTCRKASFI